MRIFARALAALFLCVIGLASPAAADGRTVITQEAALAGNVTLGDGPGFPLTISEPGSYVFQSNILAAPGKNAIAVTASNVTIDMNGFTLDGNDKTALNGIYSPGQGLLNLTVRNGTIWNFKTSGILTAQSFINIDGVQVYFNGKDGLKVSSWVRVTNSNIGSNLGRGIRCGFYCHIEGNNITGNGEDGVSLNFGLVLNNTINFNAGLGILSFDGYEAGAGGNSLTGNNGINGDQVEGVMTMQPNACSPECIYSPPGLDD